MGIIVFIGFCLIALIVVCAIIGAGSSSGDTRKQHLHQVDRNPYLADYMDKADMELLMEDDDIRTEFCDEVEGEFYDDAESGLMEEDDEELYGGIPLGDDKIYMTDDDDFVEEFGDDVM